MRASGILLSVFTLLIVGSPTWAATVRNHEIDFLGVTYNIDGTSTWTYSVTSDENGKTRALSHWILGLCGSANVISPVESYTTIGSFGSASGRNGIDWTVEVGADPTTSVSFGIKFEDAKFGGSEDNLGEDGAQETDIFQFTLDKHHPIALVSVAVKDGAGYEVGQIDGPSCAVVPLPAAVWGGMAMLCIIVVSRLRRQKAAA